MLTIRSNSPNTFFIHAERRKKRLERLFQKPVAFIRNIYQKIVSNKSLSLLAERLMRLFHVLQAFVAKASVKEPGARGSNATAARLSLLARKTQLRVTHFIYNLLKKMRFKKSKLNIFNK